MITKEPHKLLKEAERSCIRQGARLTRQRRRVLEILCGSQKPLGAYEILESLRGEQPRIAPPTVYRALEFLLQHGLIHRLETLHAYMGCAHPDHAHVSQFLICSVCGDVTELEDSYIAESVHHAAAASGFQPKQRVVEITGVCAGCTGDAG